MFDDKELKSKKSFTFSLFSGNAGGYIGMFLGWSLLSLPGMFQLAMRKAKEMICPKKKVKQDVECSF